MTKYLFSQKKIKLSARSFLPALLLLPLGIKAQNVYHVSQNGTGNGSSWANAAGDLQAVINAAADSSQVWVAAGTYKPNRRADSVNIINTDHRYNAFVLKPNVKVYGGFAGTETLLSQRDWNTNATILSGDIGTPDSSKDNCLHVVVSAGDVGIAAIDGFTITKGYANINGNIRVNGHLIDGNSGGGLLIYSSSPAVTNCSFTEDTAYANDQDYGGGGIVALGCNSIISNCKFSKNYTNYYGGGILVSQSPRPTIQNCSFTENRGGYGGAMGILNSKPAIKSCIFSANRANYNGGAIHSGSSGYIIINSIFVGNSAVSAGAIWHWDDGIPTVVNCTVYGNTATENYIGGIYNYTKVNVYNTIIWGNTGGQIYGSGGDVTVTSIKNSLIQNLYIYPYTYNSNSIPQFTDTLNIAGSDGILGTPDDGLTLQNTSPAVNTGSQDLYEHPKQNYTQWLGADLDVAGKPRIDTSGIVDMGAYEGGNGGVYRFVGNGSWADAANWQGGIMPAGVLPLGSLVIITGHAIVDTPQTLSPTTRVTVWEGGSLDLPGNLIILR